MAKIKVIAATGVLFPDAVKAALGMTQRAFAEKYGLDETMVSAIINGTSRYPYERVRDALATELNVERAWIDDQLAAMRDAIQTADGAS